MVPHHFTPNVKHIIFTLNDIAELCNLAPLIGNRCKVADDSLLHVYFTHNELYTSENALATNDVNSQPNVNNQFDNVPEYFMGSDA